MKASPNNIAFALAQWAKKLPNQSAIRIPQKQVDVSFSQLHLESNRLASGFTQIGISRGHRVLVLVPFGIDFITLTFALFKADAVPVLMDPGLGKKNMLRCIQQVEPNGMIGTPLAFGFKTLFPEPFRTVSTTVAVGSGILGGTSLKHIRSLGNEGFASAFTEPHDPAAILFTSGSTGPAKGVLYTHRMFVRQVETLQTCFGIQAGEIDVPTFPLFALFSLCMGMTCVLPKMDFTRPAKVDPENIIRPILDFEATNSFGSPALWNTVSRYCNEKKIQLPSLKRILMAGAPVPGTLLKRFETILHPECAIQTPYGATEALPVTSIGRKEILDETRTETEKGRGTCVGKPVPGLNLKIIKITDDPIPEWSDELEVETGTIGEIVVQAPWVTREYFNQGQATALAKIQDGEGFWHRMGDVGSLDPLGRVWFCGRKGQRVVTHDQTLFTIPCEAVFNVHPDVERSALVGLGLKGRQKPILIVEPANSKRVQNASEKGKFIFELLRLGGKYEHSREIKLVLFHRNFPVDLRHNAKIFREKLAQWAMKKIPPD